jgi:8-oxo-dGTP pyrophosphatase MutT (NUDIX family)
MNAPQLQISAGGVVLRAATESPHVCLILRQRFGRETWCLPKGHVEPGEDAESAALREVREETGLFAQIVEKLPTITYEFIQPGDRTRYAKRVDFFLMTALTDEIAPQDTTEVSQARWVLLSDAIALASYPKEREILQAAQQRCRKHSSVGDAGPGPLGPVVPPSRHDTSSPPAARSPAEPAR